MVRGGRQNWRIRKEGREGKEGGREGTKEEKRFCVIFKSA